jgi:hypothetical protein
MKKQLINEAKRLQQLAGIKPLNENNDHFSPASHDSVLWFFPTVTNPDEMIQELGYDNDEVIGEYPKGELFEDSELKGIVGEMYASKDEDGTWAMQSHGGDFHYRGFKEGEDFIIVPSSKMQPLFEAYGSYRGVVRPGYSEEGFESYILNHDFEMETGTDEWMNLVEIVGEENMPEYMDFLENTLKIDVL